MNITIWYLSTCSTCVRILKELNLDDSKAEMIDIKSKSLTEVQLSAMADFAGSYKALINGRSVQFRTMEKNASELNEEEAHDLLLSHYAFLKRPVIRIEQEYFIGNSKNTVEAIKSRLKNA